MYPTIIGLICGAIGWFLKSYIEAQQREREALREERAKIYIDILIPFIKIFSGMSEEKYSDAIEEVKSVEYRKHSFKLVLLGDDAIVKAWNDLWQIIYKGEQNSVDLILAIGDVLLEIRRGLGLRNTTLSRQDMLRWMITDMDECDHD